jgi:hypothetical protein
MNPATIAVVSFLMVLGFMGFDVLEVFARDHVSIINSSCAAKVVYLYLFS